METPEHLLEAITFFSDKRNAHDFLVKMRWPNGIACPRMGCGSADVALIKGRDKWRCRECGRQFSAKVGTIFEDSPIGLDKWLPAMWLLSANRNGISSCELARGLKVTQKTAWFMLHRLRFAMRTESFERMSGAVEVDETYVGGRKRRPGPGGRNTGVKATGPQAGKTIVMGIRERGGKVRAFVVPNTRRSTLLPKVIESVVPGSTVYTDALLSYRGLSKSYVHEVINHAQEYVRDHHVHTNSIENFWSVLKRTIGGTYICPRPKHLDRYLDEQIFRFNSRESKDGPRFTEALRGVDGRRLTWKALTKR